MKIHRAHSYDAVERVRAELEGTFPPEWLQQAEHYKFIILPDDLKPSWIGLTKHSDEHYFEVSRTSEKGNAVQGRSQDTIGGWCAGEEHAYWVRDTPHIYLEHSSWGSAAHELAHALSAAWRAPEDALYEPGRVWSGYMLTTVSEFFACGLRAFMRPANDDVHWNRQDVAERLPKLYEYLMTKERELWT